jgi:mRNA interferase MazF
MSAGVYVPARGDVVRVDFVPQAGHEQAGNRPALVISPAEYNGRVGLALVMPITGQAKGYPFEVVIPSGACVYGVILADQLKSVDWRTRRATRLGQLDIETLREAVGRVLELIDPECEFTSDEQANE